jgi:hypothetical protein
MHATVRSYTGAPGLVDALVASGDEIRRLLREIDGFRAYYLVKTADDGAVSISVYDDKSGTDASTAAAREWIAANLPDLSAGPPEVLDGEVALEG